MRPKPAWKYTLHFHFAVCFRFSSGVQLRGETAHLSPRIEDSKDENPGTLVEGAAGTGVAMVVVGSNTAFALGSEDDGKSGDIRRDELRYSTAL